MILMLMDGLGVGGGTETMLVHLLPELRELGLECEVAVLYRPNFMTYTAHLRSLGFKVHELDVRSRWNFPQAIAKLTALVKKRKYKLIHARGFFPAVTLGMSRKLLPNTVCVSSFHAMEYDTYPAFNLRRKIRKATYSWLMRTQMNSVLGNSQAVADHHKKHLNLKHVDMIPNAIDLTEYSNPKPECADGASSELIIGVPARYELVKNHPMLFDALVLLRKQGLHPKVLLFGGGSREMQLKERVKALGLEDQVVFCGLVKSDALRIQITQSDLIVLPSLSEGFPLAVVEAMALQLAVVASRVGGIPELIEDGKSGFLFDVHNTQELADKIAIALRDPSLRRKMGLAAREKITATYDIKKIRVKWKDYYLSFIQSKGQENE